MISITQRLQFYRASTHLQRTPALCIRQSVVAMAQTSATQRQGFNRSTISNSTPQNRAATLKSSIAFIILGGLQFWMAGNCEVTSVAMQQCMHEIARGNESCKSQKVNFGDSTAVTILFEYCGFMLAFIQTAWAIRTYKHMNLSDECWIWGFCARVVLGLLHLLFLVNYEVGPGVPNWILLLFAVWAWFDVIFIGVAGKSSEDRKSTRAAESIMANHQF